MIYGSSPYIQKKFEGTVGATGLTGSTGPDGRRGRTGSTGATGFISPNISGTLGGGGSAPSSKFIKDPSKASLMFINYKDNNQYACTIQRFSLERSAENPMLYNYSIQLRAYNLQPVTNAIAVESFQDRLNQLGLITGPSVLSRIKLAVRNAKGAINSVGGAITTLGA